MSKSKVPIIKLQVNTAGIENGIDAMTASLEGLSGSIGDSFSGLQDVLLAISTNTASILEEIRKIDWLASANFGLNPVTAPQIPYLARGAVLPANKPFMAVVGDQRHGTNIEAPLTTIQEAVRMELGELAVALQAGLQALLAENRQLRRTVEAIELGDGVIGQAAARYSHRQAVMRGGAI